MRHYDIEMLRHAVPITDVMTELGLDTSLKRNVICPSREHQDKRPSAKIYERNNICFCFACNKRMNPIDIITETLNVNFREACDWLIEHFPTNCAGFYQELTETDKDSEKYPLTGNDIKLLHLSTSTEGGISLYDLWKEDRDTFNFIIAGKVADTKERLEAVICKCNEILEYFISQRNRYLNACGIKMEDLPKLQAEYPTRCFTPNSDEYKLLYYNSSVNFETDELDKYLKEYDRCIELGNSFPFEQEKEEEYER